MYRVQRQINAICAASLKVLLPHQVPAAHHVLARGLHHWVNTPNAQFRLKLHQQLAKKVTLALIINVLQVAPLVNMGWLLIVIDRLLFPRSVQHATALAMSAWMALIAHHVGRECT